MAEFKQVFDIVKSEILEVGLSFDEFSVWLGRKRLNGEYLENWTAVEMKERVREYKETMPQQMVGIKSLEVGNDVSLDSDDEQEIAPKEMESMSTGIKFNDSQPHHVSILK